MNVSGIQKLTLLDYPGKVACTIFTAGCNMRCPFCHNASLVLPGKENASISDDEFLEFLKKRRGLLDGVAVTGGEPLLHTELPELLKKIKDLGFLVKLDTNGTFPDRLRRVVEQGLVDRVAMDIKNSPEKYPKTTGIPNFDISPVFQSADFLLGDSVNYEFRTTVVDGLHDEENMVSIGKWISGAREYYLQAFTDSGDLIHGERLSGFSADKMMRFSDIVRPYVPSVQIRGIQQ